LMRVWRSQASALRRKLTNLAISYLNPHGSDYLLAKNISIYQDILII